MATLIEEVNIHMREREREREGKQEREGEREKEREFFSYFCHVHSITFRLMRTLELERRRGKKRNWLIEDTRNKKNSNLPSFCRQSYIHRKATKF